MPLIPLPIHQGNADSVDDILLSTYGPTTINGYVDSLGSINRFPGYTEFADTGEDYPIDGMYYWKTKSLLIVVCNGKTFKINPAGSVTQITGDTFESAYGYTVKFADFETELYGANGGKILKITETAVAELTDADAPTVVYSITGMDRYLLAVEAGTGNFHWSDVNAPEVWSANSAEAEFRYDDLYHIEAQKQILYLFGEETTEFWYNDGSTPFIRLYQGVSDIGVTAFDSIKWCESIGAFCVVDKRNRMIIIKNGEYSIFSESLNRYIQSMSPQPANGTIGSYIEIGGKSFYVLHFTYNAATIICDLASKKWHHLKTWNSTSVQFDLYNGRMMVHGPGSTIYVGDRANGKIYTLSNGVYDEDGEDQRFLYRTQRYNHGSARKRKFCNGIYIRLKKLIDYETSGTPTWYLRYNNGGSDWCSAITMQTINVTNNEFLAYATCLGSYGSRQWEIYSDDAHPVAITSIEEDMDFEDD